MESTHGELVLNVAAVLAKARSRAGIRQKSEGSVASWQLSVFPVRNLILDHVKQHADV